MNVFLIPAFYLSGFLLSESRVSVVELTRFEGPVPREESGVMSHGTIFDISTHQIVVITSGPGDLTRYSHGEGTIYVDESGDPISLKTVKSGSAVTVFYTQTEEHRMANKVIVGEALAAPVLLIDC